MAEHWQEPDGGKHSIAVPARDFQSKRDELEAFYGRRLLTYSYCLTLDFRSYLVVFFNERSDADLAIQTFGGEHFDIRDKGRGSKWMFWFKGRGASEDRRLSPYRFSR
jgi:hypothetical protein